MSGIPSPTKTYHKTLYPSISPSRPSLSAKDKTIIITGGGSGVGSSTAEAFARAGAANIVILGRNEKSLLDTKRAVEDAYDKVRVSTFAADVLDEGAINHVAGAVGERFGSWDVLINNAGYAPDMSLLKDADVGDWWRAFEVNVKGSLIVVKAFIPTARTNATMINVSSAAAHISYVPNLSAYSNSKTASTKLFDWLHHEHPELRVFNVHPGTLMTTLHQKNLDNGLKVKAGADDLSLPGAFMVWVASPESEFARGKLLWANWDVDELKAQAKEIERSPRFTLVLDGWGTSPTI